MNFLQEVSLTEIDENHSDLYKGYTQFLFVFKKAEPLDTDGNRELVSQLNDAWLQLVTETYRQAIDTEENMDHNLNERMTILLPFSSTSTGMTRTLSLISLNHMRKYTGSSLNHTPDRISILTGS